MTGLLRTPALAVLSHGNGIVSQLGTDRLDGLVGIDTLEHVGHRGGRGRDILVGIERLAALSFDNSIGEEADDDADGSLAVIIGGNEIVDLVGVGVGVAKSEHRDVKNPGLGNGVVLGLGVDDDDGLGKHTDFLDAPRGSG